MKITRNCYWWMGWQSHPQTYQTDITKFCWVCSKKKFVICFASFVSSFHSFQLPTIVNLLFSDLDEEFSCKFLCEHTHTSNSLSRRSEIVQVLPSKFLQFSLFSSFIEQSTLEKKEKKRTKKSNSFPQDQMTNWMWRLHYICEYEWISVYDNYFHRMTETHYSNLKWKWEITFDPTT